MQMPHEDCRMRRPPPLLPPHVFATQLCSCSGRAWPDTNTAGARALPRTEF